MKKLFIFVFMFGIFFSNNVFAQTNNSTLEPVLMATVNIHNTKIISQSDRDFSLSFEISNRLGVQSQIKYSIRLFQGTSTVNELVYPEKLTLAEDSLVTKVIKYHLPDNLKGGKYEIFVESKNEAGLPLAVASFGEVSVKDSVKQAINIIDESCYMVKSDDASSTKYFLPLTPDVASTTNVTLHCEVLNSFSSDLEMKTSFDIRKGGLFSEIQQSTTSEGLIAIKSGKNNISVILPKMLVPQFYTISFRLASTDNKINSNTINPQYFVLGETGNIQNVILDKTFYLQGDKAMLKIYQVSNSGISATSTISVFILDGNGDECSTFSEYSVNKNSLITGIIVPIIKNCVDPKAVISLSQIDLKGNKVILDSKDFSVKTPKDLLPKGLQGTYSIQFIIFSIIILILLVSILVYKKINRNSIKVLILIFSLFSVYKTASADTYGLPAYDYWWSKDAAQVAHHYYNVTFSPLVYPNENVYIGGAVSNSNANSSVFPLMTSISVRINNNASYVSGAGCFGNCSRSGYASFAASTFGVGQHTINVGTYSSTCNKHEDSDCGYNSSYWWNKNPHTSYSAYNFGFTIGYPSSSINASSTKIEYNSSTTISWTSQNISLCKVQANGVDWKVPYYQPIYAWVYHPYGKVSHTECYWDWGGQHCYEKIDQEWGCNCSTYDQVDNQYMNRGTGVENSGLRIDDTIFDLKCYKDNVLSASSSIKVAVKPTGANGVSQVGSCNITGWACDRSNLDKKITVELSTSTGGIVLKSGTAALDDSVFNPTVSAANNCGTANGNHGFSLTLPTDSTLRDGLPHQIVVTARDVDSLGNQTGTSTSWSTSLTCAVSGTGVDLKAIPEQITKNSSTTIVLNAPTATTCTIKKGATSYAGNGTSRSVDSGILTANTTFSALCSNTGGNLPTAYVVVGVFVPPKAVTSKFDANGELITWETSDAKKCFLTVGTNPPEEVPVSGSKTIPGLTVDTPISLKCDNDGGSVTWNILSQPPAVISNCSVSQINSADKIYIGKKTKFDIALSGDTQLTDIKTQWLGTNISNEFVDAPASLEKVYTTIGQKSVIIRTTGKRADGKDFSSSCTVSLKVQLDSGIGSGEQ